MKNLLYFKKRLSFLLVVILVVNIFITCFDFDIKADNNLNLEESNIASSSNADEFKLADKKAEYIKTDEDEQRYRISLTVPGYEEDPIQNQVIVVLDASDSQGNNWSSVKESILAIGDSVLNETSKAFVNKLTLIGFGISDKIVAQDITSYHELSDLLDELPTNYAFLYGRSGTNCEVGITSAISYINSLDELDGAYVIYVSDSNSNMDEELISWEEWTENKSWHWGGRTTEVLAKMLLMDYEYDRILGGGEPIPVTKDVFNWSFDNFVDEYITVTYLDNRIEELEERIQEIEYDLGLDESPIASPSNYTYDIATASEITNIDGLEEEYDELNDILDFLNSVYNDFSSDGYNGDYTEYIREGFIVEFNNINLYSTLKTLSDDEKNGIPYWRIWVDGLWKDVYENSDLIWGEGVKYPVSYIEHAFIDYDNKYKSNISDSFYTAIVKFVFEDIHTKPKTKGLRAAKASDELALLDEVRKVYMIGYGSSASDSWMNPDRDTKYETGNYVTEDNISYYHVSDMTKLGEALSEICPDIITK